MGGAAVTPIEKVLPESGPNSAKRVVSWTRRSEIGACQPLLMKHGSPLDRLLLADQRLDVLVAVLLLDLRHADPELEAAEGVERVLGEHLPAREALGGDREVARVLAVVPGVVGVVRVEEVGLVEEVDPVVQAAREVGVAAVVDAVRGHRQHREREQLVAQHVGERDRRAAVEVAARRHADVDRRPALEVEALEDLLAALVLRHHLVRHVGLEVDEALGGGLHLLVDLLDRLDRVLRVQLELALVVGDEGEAVAARGPERRRRHRAAEHVGVLLDRPRPQVEAAQVRDVVVLVRGVVDLRRRRSRRSAPCRRRARR